MRWLQVQLPVPHRHPEICVAVNGFVAAGQKPEAKRANSAGKTRQIACQIGAPPAYTPARGDVAERLKALVC